MLNQVQNIIITEYKMFEMKYFAKYFLLCIVYIICLAHLSLCYQDTYIDKVILLQNTDTSNSTKLLWEKVLSSIEDVVILRMKHLQGSEVMEQASTVNKIFFDNNERVSSSLIYLDKQLDVYLTHVMAWQSIEKGETSLIIEDNAIPKNQQLFSELQSQRSWENFEMVKLVHKDLHGYEESMSVQNVLECIYETCHSKGTSAYILTYLGSQKLLRHAFPPTLQLDTFIDSFPQYVDNNFETAVTQIEYVTPSKDLDKIEDSCLLCLMPHSNSGILLWICCVFVFGIVTGFLTQLGSGYKKLENEDTKSELETLEIDSDLDECFDSEDSNSKNKNDKP